LFVVLVLTAVGWIGAASTTPARAQSPAPPPAPAAAAAPAPAIDAKADAVLRQMGKTLADAKSLAFEAEESSDQVVETGQHVQFSRRVRVALRRPDRLAATVRGDAGEDLAYTYNGKTLTILNHHDHVHAIQEVPRTIDEAFDFLAERFGITPPLADVMFSDPYQALIGQARSGWYVGLHEVAGVKCHHLAFRQDAIDWQVWVEDGPRAVPRKIVITHKELPGYPQFIAVLDKWDLSVNLPDSSFESKIPPDSKRVDLQPIEPRAASPTALPSPSPATQPGRAGGSDK
jgi:hypothetical protein